MPVFVIQIKYRFPDSKVPSWLHFCDYADNFLNALCKARQELPSGVVILAVDGYMQEVCML